MAVTMNAEEKKAWEEARTSAIKRLAKEAEIVLGQEIASFPGWFQGILAIGIARTIDSKFNSADRKIGTTPDEIVNGVLSGGAPSATKEDLMRKAMALMVEKAVTDQSILELVSSYKKADLVKAIQIMESM